jgi:hypothetical protein
MALLINPSDRTGHSGHPLKGVSRPSGIRGRLRAGHFRTNVRFVRFVPSPPGTQPMSARTILGIDPGAHGAIAMLDETGQLLELEDMPTTVEAGGRSSTNAPLLAGILARSHAEVVYCEFVSARPTDAKVAAFSFGRARGVIEGACGALALPIIFLTAPTWKRFAKFRLVLKTRTWPALGQLPAGQPMRNSSGARPTLTAQRPA